MDENNCEQIFKTNSARKSTALYTAKSSDPSDIKPQDVLDSVYSQIRKMQLADGRSSKIDKDFSGVKKSDFLTVNKLPNYNERAKQTNTFETQCISNTQLINIIEDVEASIVHHKGMTQEFETTFIQNLDKNSDTHNRDTKKTAMFIQNDTSDVKTDCDAIKKSKIGDKTTLSQSKSINEDIMEPDEFETTFTQTNVDNTVSFLLDKIGKEDNIDSTRKVHIDMENVSQDCEKVEESNDLKKNIYTISIDREKHHETAKKTDILKMCKHTNDNLDYSDSKLTVVANDIVMQNVAIEIENIKTRSPSPVFNNIAKTRNKKSLPLVVALESYEKFERLVVPLIESNDFNACKHLINSQLLGGELCLNTGDILFKNDGTSSPILEKSCELFKEKPAKTPEHNVKNNSEIKDSNDKQSDCLEDEILFSSDEENDYIHRAFLDLPLTVALEKPFYNHSYVLEEPMYVGFQTASNKPIQICTKSFHKAQYLLDEDKKYSKDFSNTEHLEISQKKCNSSDFKVEEKINLLETKLAIIDIPGKETGDQSTGHKKIMETYYDNTEIMPPDKNNTIIRTSNNKNIVFPDRSLKLDKNVFMDIDVIDDVHSTSKDFKVVIGDNDSNINKSPECVDDKINDDLILQEFENIEMSLEEIETTHKIHDFQGFKTANNKSIKISDAAQAKISMIFQNIDLGEITKPAENVNDANNFQPGLNKTVSQFSCSTPAFAGFKTANNKNIKVSTQALAKTNKIFQDIDNRMDNDSDFKQTSTSKATFEGFKMANNKEYQISGADNISKPALFKDIDSEKPYFQDEKNSYQSFQGFKTASNKNVKISAESLLKSKKLFQDMNKNHELVYTNNLNNNRSFSDIKTAYHKATSGAKGSLTNNMKMHESLVSPNLHDIELYGDDNINKNIAFQGFKTASNKAVVVSKQALEKSRNAFQDIDEANYNKSYAFKEGTLIKQTARFNNVLNKDIGIDNDSLETFAGFKTASKKNIIISDEAIAKSNIVFDETKLDECKGINKTKRTTLGFHMANNKKIEVSKESIERTKSLFNDFETDQKDSISISFQTANKKKVGLSNEAVKNTKAIFEDIEITKQEKPTFMGFQTASKKTVEVSKEAIEKTKALFKDIEILKQEEETLMDFQTALKKKVEVSKEAKEHTKVLFNKDPGINVSLPKKSVFSFMTANNNKTNVTEEALQKSRRYLDISKDTPKNISDSSNKINNRKSKALTDVNIDNIINTQVLNHFEESLCTEDFNETPRNKRSSSPILFCPRAKKKKKFETPYKDVNTICNKIIEPKIPTKITLKPKEDNEKTKLFTENYKKNKVFSLKDLLKFDNNNCNIDPYIPNFSLDNILRFEFVGKRNEFTGTKIKIKELKDMFLSGVNNNLVPDGWLDNHLKLILWKLLSYEIKLSYCLCTVQNVLDQLKYRYDKELYNAERPVLRKIFEKDDVSTKTMVLCVAGICVDGASVNSVTTSENIELLLTDGWYFIKATIDKMLSTLVHRGRIVVGSKLVTTGAELLNCEQGIAPWEDTSAIRLKLSGNSTRPAPWHTTLGYSTAAILSRLLTVKLDGGKVARLKVYVARLYPLLYVEKFTDGSTVTRSERLEHLHQMKYEAERELMMERIYEEVQKEFSDQESQDSEGTPIKRKCLETGSQIAKMMKRSKDPTEFRAQLSSSQVHQLQQHTSRHRDKMLEAIQAKIQERHIDRNVVTLVRCRIVDVVSGGVVKGMLSIWKPNDAILELLKEGSWVEIMNVVPTAVRYSEIQITAGRQSLFRPVKTKTEYPNLLTLKRTCYKISDVADNPAMTTDYNEIDTVGIVFLIEPNNQEFESSRNFQNVYLADADKNIICVSFWGGVKKFGFQNILDTGQIVACANLQKRAGNTGRNVPQFRATEFSIFTKTPKNIQARELVDDLNKALLGLDRRKFCDDCIAIRNNYTAIRCFGNTDHQSPYRYNQNDYSLTRNKMFIDTPVGIKVNDVRSNSELNLTGLDFDSSFKQAQELTPRSLQRKKKANERIAKLKMYGEPPPLSPINIINKSSNARNSYKSPLTISHAQSSVDLSKVPEESPETVTDCEKSPIISLKRSYVRTVPVKLNFDCENSSVDHFAEEFDASPPLSLE